LRVVEEASGMIVFEVEWLLRGCCGHMKRFNQDLASIY
jgi:hypothetical protein